MHESDDILKVVTQSLSASEGEFFEALFGGMANALRVDFVFVAEVLDGSRVRTLAFQADGHFIENLEYELAATPCAQVVQGKTRLIEKGASQAYPENPMFSRYGIQSYLGIPLKRHDGAFLGLMVLMGREPFASPAMSRKVCEIFAARAASELERKKAQEEKTAALALLEATFQATADGIVVVDRCGRVISFNQKFCDLWNLSADLLRRATRQEVLSRMLEQLKRPEKTFEEVAALGGKPEQTATGTFLFRSGRVFEWYSQPHRLGEQINGRVWSFRDVTDRVRAEQELTRSREFYLRAFEGASALIWRLSTQGRYDYFNRTWIDFMGTSLEQELRQDFAQRAHPEDRDFVREQLFVAAQENRPVEIEYRLCSPGRGCSWVLDMIRPLLNEAGELEGYLGICFDITARHKSLEELRQLKRAVEQSPVSIVVTDASGAIEYANPRFLELTGFDPQEVLGKNPRVLKSGLVPDEVYQELWETIASGREWRGELLNRKKSGDLYWESVSISPIVDDQDRITHFVGVKEDITERKRDEAKLLENEKRLHHMAHHDPLTKLPNRALLYDRLEQGMARSRRMGTLMAVLLLDLDRFKAINDQLGHDTGDQLLCEVGHRLRSVLREADTLARFGGDEFVILLEELKDREEAVMVARKVLNSLSQPFRLRGKEVQSGTSVGIALFPEDEHDVEGLLRCADTALYRAKHDGRGIYRLYSQGEGEQGTEHLIFEKQLRQSLQREELELYFQPVLDIGRQELIGVEALIRWNHPELGVVLPEEFLLLAENSGLCVAIGNWVLEQACRFRSRAAHLLAADCPVMVNVCSRHMRQPDFLGTLRGVLKEAGLEASALCLEFREEVLLDDPGAMVEKLSALKSEGVKLCLDDFGSGYSSLGALGKLGLDLLKIDRPFIQSLERDQGASSVVRSILSLGTGLDCRVVAEGVENQTQLTSLMTLGCYGGQGFFWAPPMDEPSALKWFQARG